MITDYMNDNNQKDLSKVTFENSIDDVHFTYKTVKLKNYFS